ncbi:MAG: APC family permease [Thermoproteus sp. AZ2]|uniref:APC family permease n=1 Tax=Thermoproteus sp. AZ2 TaxID=1609232 RepID=A0ACC6UZE8_9CREN
MSKFLRESSGLVREIGPWAALLMNTAYITFQSGYLLLISSWLNFPSGNLTAAVLLGAVLFIPVGYLFYFVGTRYYRTASDYIFSSRSLHPAVGVGSLFMFTVDQMFYNAVMMAFAVTTVLGPSLMALGLAWGSAGLTAEGSYISTSSLAEFAIGAALLALLIAINMASVKAGKYLASALSALAFISYAAVLAVLAARGLGGAAEALSRYAPGVYEETVKAGSSLGGTSLDTFLLLPYMAYIFPYVNFLVTVGGEVRRGKAMAVGVLGTYAVTAALVALGVWLSASALSPAFINGAFYLYYNGQWPQQLPPPYPQVIAALEAKNPALQAFLALAPISWYLNSPSVIVVQIARYLFAMSFDRVLPAAVAYVHPRTHTPLVAHAIDLALSLSILYLYSFSLVPNLVATMDISTVATILMYFVVVAAAAIALGVKSRSPSLAAVGAYSTALFLWVAYEELANPEAYLFTPITNAWIFGFFAAVFALGALTYYIARWYRLRSGIDIAWAFKEIPPE